MGDDWRDLQLVLAVSAHGSLTAAGKALGVAPSTISRRLDALEAGLGVTLFVRHATGYRLTDRGAHLIQALSPMLDAAQEWQRRAFSQEVQAFSYITLSAPSLVLTQLSGVFADLLYQHPEIKLTILEDNAVSDLARGEADVAIRVVAEPDETLWGHLLGEVTLVVAASPAYLDALDDEASASWVVIDYKVSGNSISRLERALIDPSRRLVETNSRHVALELLRRGCGLGVLPRQVVEREPGLEIVRTIDLERPLRLWCLTSPERKGDPAIQAVMRFLVEQGRQLL